ELYSDPSTSSEPLAVAPKTVATAVSNSDSNGAVWAAFESPFSDGMRIPVVGVLAAPSGAVRSWTPYLVPGIEQIGQISSIFVDDRGVVWLGGMDGMLRLVPSDLKPVEAPHLPVIRASVGFGEKLPAKRNSVSFDFSAVEYTMRGSVRFETKLSGGLDEWSAPTNNNHLGLAGLQNGTYDFSVRAVNDAGMAGPTATWSFTVLPPWYRTLPALIAFVLVLAAAVFGAFRWRLAFLKRQNVRLEILVQKKTEQLQKANEAKSEFLANMSHEIRNPISGILGLSLAFQETKLEGRQRQILDSISSCATLLATLVDDVLDFSKIEAGTIELRSAPFNLRGLLEQCVAMMAETARAAGVGITVTVAPELPEQIVGNSARVQQIVLNYVTNALKFGAGKPIVLGASKGFHDRVRFFVRDQGAGMTAAEIATLFTKFTRLESARAGNIRGTGLGLAVCKLLATKMGGRVGVDSKPGEGSCFWAEIPFLTVYGVAQGAAPQVRAGTTLRALIVEDIDYNVIAMQAVLRKLDIQSDVVNDGNEALARLQATHYDVAFLDWNLPGIIGTEVAARYRAVEPSTQRTIIIATTAHSSDFNKEACLQAGMDAFISKPITPAKIAAALRDLGGPMRTAASIEVRSQNITFEPPGEIDLEMLTFLGSETLEGLAGQIDNFLAAFDNDRVSARHIIANGAPTEIHRIAHRLLSHCSVVKYEALSRLARNIQNSSATASRAELQRMFGEFETEFSSFRYKLESIRASTGSV
ncbi:MAG: ATP-binding protein, partial [Opitutaceae bacterium]